MVFLHDGMFNKNTILLHLILGAGIGQTVWWLATGWKVRASNSGGGEVFRTHPDHLWGPHSPLYNGYKVYCGSKAAGAWRWPPTPSRAEVERRVELYISYTSWPSCPVMGGTFTSSLPLHLNQVRHQSEAAQPLTQAVKTVNFKTQCLMSQGSSVSIMTSLREESGSFCGRGKRLCLLSDWLWDPRSLLFNGYGGSFPAFKAAGAWD